ncbi:hypothetical protein [Pseudoflavitalea rhizosphaerae]|uniref:hypothetical protein n=1 Tax=Pseudoflavitalea rhizosphaerae TaxID=1884793 RepID=UPI0013E0977C|nr:hypothetical protein [Pseudoflavitalea rhizosphaerae]
MKKYLPPFLVLMTGIFLEIKPVTPVEPGDPEPGNTDFWSQSRIMQGASAKIAILYLPE